MPNPALRLLRAGLVTGLVDGAFACVLFVGFYHSTFARLWQGVASTLLGRESFQGGTRTVLIGLLMHFGVAFFWSAVFLFLFTRSTSLRQRVRSPLGILTVAALAGPAIWMAMSLAVIPLLAQRLPTINSRWWIQLFGHIFFVGLPIVASIAWGTNDPDE